MGEPERGLTPNGVVARDGDGGGEFIIERDIEVEVTTTCERALGGDESSWRHGERVLTSSANETTASQKL